MFRPTHSRHQLALIKPSFFTNVSNLQLLLFIIHSYPFSIATLTPLHFALRACLIGRQGAPRTTTGSCQCQGVLPVPCCKLHDPRHIRSSHINISRWPDEAAPEQVSGPVLLTTSTPQGVPSRLRKSTPVTPIFSLTKKTSSWKKQGPIALWKNQKILLNIIAVREV